LEDGAPPPRRLQTPCDARPRGARQSLLEYVASFLERLTMLAIARFGLSFLVGVATYFFVFWVPFSLLSFLPGHFLLATLGSFVAAIWAGRYTWRRTDEAQHGGVLALTLGGALVVGAVGFVGGFFGPMIFAPEANQGPLLGLFITGPLGFVLGGVGGFVYGLVRRFRHANA
jgi:hypothetical protein